MLETLKSYIRLRRLAKKHGVPLKVKDRYIDTAGLNLGHLRYKNWVSFANSHGFDMKLLRPLADSDDGYIATYRIVKAYQKGYCGSDYACGDSGCNGDFMLERVDFVEASAGGEG